MNIKFLIVKERIQNGQLSIERIRKNSMITDPLTKGIPPKVFHVHVVHMGIASFDEVSV